MLAALSIGRWFRMAMALATFAMLCFVAPPGLIAFGHGDHTVECLAHADMVDHGMAGAHDITHHGDHSLPSGAHQPGSGCCGLFCMSAVAADLGELVEAPDAGPVHIVTHQPSMLSRAPEGPERPPNPLVIV
jgi:hypothetical protein